MNFTFTDEQTMLRDGVQKFMRQAYSFEQYRKISGSKTGYSPEIWAQMADLQWLALPFAETDGGLDGGPVELMLLTEQLGRGLCVEPYLANIVLSGQLLSRLGDAQQKDAYLKPMLNGASHVSLAYLETAGRHQHTHCETKAIATADGYRLEGRKSLVLNGPNANQFIVLARLSGGISDATGLGLFIVDAKASGVSLESYAVLGGGSACELRLDHVKLRAEQRLGTGDTAFEILGDVLDLAIACTCADAYGAMQALLERTAEYLKTRKQFGAVLGSFQVLQHRAVDMFVETQQSQSMILMTMIRLQDPDRRERQKAASACKAYLHKASKFVAQQAVQLHGGIGMTEELSIGHYFRRLTAFGNLFGDREHHLQRMASLTQ